MRGSSCWLVASPFPQVPKQVRGLGEGKTSANLSKEGREEGEGNRKEVEKVCFLDL